MIMLDIAGLDSFLVGKWYLIEKKDVKLLDLFSCAPIPFLESPSALRRRRRLWSQQPLSWHGASMSGFPSTAQPSPGSPTADFWDWAIANCPGHAAELPYCGK